MKLCSSLGRVLLIALALAAGCGTSRATCQIQQITTKGTTQLVLENDLVRATFTPDQGGECTGLVVKAPDGEHNDFTVSLFNDMDYSHSFDDQGAFSGVPYTFTILENKPDVVSVAFDRQGVQDFAYVAIHKVMTLRDHERVIQADYEVRNLPVSMARKTVRLWLHNGLFPSGLKANYYWATPAGLETNAFPASRNLWDTKAPRGWSGVVNEPATSGIACVLDYKDLASLYDWMGTTAANMEWRYQPQDILSGASYRTTMRVVPFAGLDHIDHAGATGVYAWDGLSPDGTAVLATLSLAAARTETLGVEVRLRPTNSATGTVLVSSPLQGDPSGVVKLQVPLPALQPGRYVISTQVTLPGGDKDLFEKLLVVGGAPDNGDYSYVAFEPKNPNQEAAHYAPYQLSTDFVTPHIPWFTPYAGGPVKTLFVMPWFQGRTAVEAFERVSLKMNAPVLGTSDSLYFSGELPPLSDTFEEKTDAYWSAFEDDLTKNQDYNVIVLTFPWPEVPSNVRATLKGLMAKGVGLLVPQNKLDTKNELGLLFKNATNPKVIPFPGGDCTWSTASVTPPPSVPGQVAVPGGETRLCAFDGAVGSYGFCRSLLWAAGREPSVDASIDWPSNRPITRDDLVAQGCPLRVHSVEVPAGVTALTVVSRNNVACYSHEEPLDFAPGDFAKTLALPLLPSGQYDCQVSLKSHGQVLATALAQVQVTDAVTIDAITLPQPIIAVGAPAKGTVVFRNALTTPVIRQYSFALVDSYHRTLDQANGTVSIPPSGLETVDFSLTDPSPLAVVHNVLVTLRDTGQVVATSSALVTCPDVNYPADDYLSFVWPDSGGLGDRGPANYLLHDNVGFNLEFGRGQGVLDPPYQREFSFGGIGAAYNDWSASNVRTSRKFSLTEPKTRATILSDFTKMADNYAPYGVFGFDAADEPSLSAWEEHSELDYSPTSMAGFAVWIQKKYPSLDALNAEWGTSFKTWAEVAPMIESEAKDHDNLAPWNDFRDYMEDQWTDFLRELRDRALKNNPKALFGVCGVQDGHPYSGFDMWKIHDICTMVMPYTNSAVERSFTPNGRFGKYTGYRISPDAQVKEDWTNFFDGQTILSYFLGTYPVNVDFSVSHTYADPVRQALQLFQGGMGKLFMDVPRQNDRIAIHYSQSSIRVNYMLKYRENATNDVLGLYRQDRLDYEGMFHDMGYDATYLAYGQIEAGDLTPANYRVLVLPLSTALSAKEVAAIRAYVAAGGIVIADGLTGLYDEHGKPNGTGSLDDLFGITRHQAAQNRLTYTTVTMPGQATPLQVCVETGIDGGAAKPLFPVTATTPALAPGSLGAGLGYARSVGTGHAVYLDFLSGYVRALPQSEGMASLFRAVFANVGIAPPAISVTTGDGKPAAVQLLRHQAPGETGLYLGLLQRDEMPSFTGPVTVTLTAPMHVYDLITGRYLGHVSTFPVTLTPGIGQLFAALPAQVTGVAIQAPASAHPGTSASLNFAVRTSGGAPETHVLHMTATGPDGADVPYLTRNLLAPAGNCTLSVPFALDAPAGKWTVTVRDVATGVLGSATIRVGN